MLSDDVLNRNPFKRKEKSLDVGKIYSQEKPNEFSDFSDFSDFSELNEKGEFSQSKYYYEPRIQSFIRLNDKLCSNEGYKYQLIDTIDIPEQAKKEILDLKTEINEFFSEHNSFAMKIFPMSLKWAIENKIKSMSLVNLLDKLETFYVLHKNKHAEEFKNKIIEIDNNYDILTIERVLNPSCAFVNFDFEKNETIPAYKILEQFFSNKRIVGKIDYKKSNEIRKMMLIRSLKERSKLTHFNEFRSSKEPRKYEEQVEINFKCLLYEYDLLDFYLENYSEKEIEPEGHIDKIKRLIPNEQTELPFGEDEFQIEAEMIDLSVDKNKFEETNNELKTLKISRLFNVFNYLDLNKFEKEAEKLENAFDDKIKANKYLKPRDLFINQEFETYKQEKQEELSWGKESKNSFLLINKLERIFNRLNKRVIEIEEYLIEIEKNLRTDHIDPYKNKEWIEESKDCNDLKDKLDSLLEMKKNIIKSDKRIKRKEITPTNDVADAIRYSAKSARDAGDAISELNKEILILKPEIIFSKINDLLNKVDISQDVLEKIKELVLNDLNKSNKK